MSAGAAPIAPPADDRHARRRPARPLRPRRRPPRRLSHVVLDPDPAAPAGAVADATSSPPTTTPPPSTSWRAVRRRHHGVREPAGAALQRLARDVVVAPPRRRGDRPGPHRREVVPRGRRHPRRRVRALVDDADLDAAAHARRAARSSRPPGSATTARANGRSNDADGVAAAWEELDRVPCIVERRVDLDVEVSVVIARSGDGPRRPIRSPRTSTATASSTSPSCRRGSIRRSPTHARRVATQIAEALDYVGRAGSRDVRLVRSAARQRVGAAAAQQRALDARRGADQPVQPAGPGDHRSGARRDVDDGAGGGDGEPARRPVVPARRRRADRAGMDDGPRRPATHGFTCTEGEPRPGRKMGHVTVLGDDVDGWPTQRCDCAPRASRNRTGPPTPFGDDAVMQQPPERIELAAGVVLRRLHSQRRRRAAGRRSRRAASTCARSCRGPTRITRPPPRSSPRRARAGRRARASATSSPRPATTLAVTASGCSAVADCTGAAVRNRSRSATGCVPTPSAAA